MRKETDYWATFEEGLSYHIYSRSINKENIFQEDRYCQYFLEKCQKLILPFFQIEAYCIMPNHYHLLVSVKPISEAVLEKIKWQGTSKSMKFLQQEISYNEFLIDQYKRFFQSFVWIYNKDKNRNGSLFQKKFKRILIKDEFRWRHVLAYIHHNPIHHKFRKEYTDWKFSSYCHFLSNTDILIAQEAVLKRFDEDVETAKELYVKFHQDFKIEKGMDDLYLE